MARQGLSSLPLKAVTIASWGLFGAMVGLSLFFSNVAGFSYTLETSIATYSAVIQGLGAMVAIASVGLVIRRERISGEIREVEERALRELSNRLGWNVLIWDDELERRIASEVPAGGYAASYAQPAQIQQPSAEVAAAQPPPPPPASDKGEQLESELDELLETIMVEEGTTTVTVPAPAAVPIEALKPSPPVAIHQAVVQTEDLHAAVENHRLLVAQRRELVGGLVHPLAMNSSLVTISALGLPMLGGLLSGDPFLNTTMVFLTTYGSIVSVGFTALVATRLLAR